MFDYVIHYFSNAHQVYCEDSPAKGIYDHCQHDDLDLHSRSEVRLKLDYFLTCNISDNIYAITCKLGMAVDLWMPKNAHARLDDLDLDTRQQSKQ